MEVRPISKNSAGLAEAKALYLEAFPANERLPFWQTLRRAQKPHIHLWGYYDNEQFVGLLNFVVGTAHLHIMYLAVSEGARSKGYGGRILRHIEQQYPGLTLVLDCESTKVAAENSAQRQRRLAFYTANGYKSAGFSILDGGVLYETLIKNGNCTVAEYAELEKLAAGRLLYPLQKSKIVM